MPKNGLQKRGVRTIDEERFETIRNHLLDPQMYPLQTKEEEQQLRRVQQAALLMQDYPNEAHVVTLMLQCHRVSRTQIRRDIALAKELFKTDFEFDWDFWRAWQIKDQLELIREAKLKGDLREWNNAKKLIRDAWNVMYSIYRSSTPTDALRSFRSINCAPLAKMWPHS